MDDWWGYLCKNMVIVRNVFTISVTMQKVLIRDPLRYAFTIPTSTSYNLNMAWGDQPETVADTQIPSSNTWIYLNRNNIGELITYPLWISGSAGPFPNIVVWTISFDPTRYAAYERYIQRSISQFGSS